MYRGFCFLGEISTTPAFGHPSLIKEGNKRGGFIFSKKEYNGGMKKSGFTLIELLVVIAIMGILTAIVTTNLGTARQKARDTKRVSDIKQLQLALALYADAHNNYYPPTLSPIELIPLSPTFIQAIPVPPGGTSQTAYSYVGLGTGLTCTSYHLGALLEVTGSSVLLDDSDATAVGTNCSSATDFSGADTGGTDVCRITGATADCFDVKP